MLRSLSDSVQSHDNNYLLLRHILVVCVLFNHSFALLFPNQVQPEPLYLLTNFCINFGSAAVSIFFTLSGLLIAQSATRSSSVESFIKKRWWRVFPALLMSILLAVITGIIALNISPVEIFSSYCQFGVTSYLAMAVLLAFAAVIPLGLIKFPRIKTVVSILLLLIIVVTFSGLPTIFKNDPRVLFLSGYIHQCSSLGIRDFGLEFETPFLNLSIWSIRYELLMYAIAALFMMIPKKYWTFSWAHLYLISFLFIVFSMDPKLLQNLDWIPYVPRFLICFASGVLMHSFAKFITPGYFLPLVALGLVCIGKLFGLLSLSYLIFGTVGIVIAFSGKRIFRKWSEFDLSYGLFVYGYIVQRLLVILFPSIKNPYLFFIICTVISGVLSAISWKLLEKPSLRFASSSKA